MSIIDNKTAHRRESCRHMANFRRKGCKDQSLGMARSCLGYPILIILLLLPEEENFSALLVVSLPHFPFVSIITEVQIQNFTHF